MERYCLSKGIPPSALIIEPKAKNTIENAQYTAEIMKTKGYTSTYVITNRHHMARSKILFEAVLNEVVVVPAKENVVTYLSFLPLRFLEQKKIMKLQNK